MNRLSLRTHEPALRGGAGMTAQRDIVTCRAQRLTEKTLNVFDGPIWLVIELEPFDVAERTNASVRCKKASKVQGC